MNKNYENSLIGPQTGYFRFLGSIQNLKLENFKQASRALKRPSGSFSAWIWVMTLAILDASKPHKCLELGYESDHCECKQASQVLGIGL